MGRSTLAAATVGLVAILLAACGDPDGGTNGPAQSPGP